MTHEVLNYSYLCVDRFYNSQLLEESYFIKLNSISLTITDPQSFHTGTYTLTTHTVVGNATAEFYIDVFYAPEAGPGTMSLTEEFTTVGKNITLYCEVTDANPPPTTEWFKVQFHKVPNRNHTELITPFLLG